MQGLEESRLPQNLRFLDQLQVMQTPLHHSSQFSPAGLQTKTVFCSMGCHEITKKSEVVVVGAGTAEFQWCHTTSS